MGAPSNKDFIGRTLQRAYKQTHARLVRELHRKGYSDITVAQAELLSCVTNDGSSIVALAKVLGITKQATGELVKQLDTLGYITKTSSARDGRSYVIVLDRRGQQLIADATQIKRRIEQEFVDLLGKQRFEILITSLQQLAAGE